MGTIGTPPPTPAEPLSNQPIKPAADRAAPPLPANATAVAGTQAKLPDWATRLITLYESNAASQFVVHGNVSDRCILPLAPAGGDVVANRVVRLGTLTEFIQQVLLTRFEVVLSYDLANGLRVEKGENVMAQWPLLKAGMSLPQEPTLAISMITRYLRFLANLAQLSRPTPHVGVFLRSAGLIAPAVQGATGYDLAALALNIRDWGADPRVAGLPFASFLLTENVSDLHPLITSAPGAAKIKVPLPDGGELLTALNIMAPLYPEALGQLGSDMPKAAGALTGSTVGAVESMLRTRQHTRSPISDADLVSLKKDIVENQTAGLVEFIKPDRSLDDLQGQEKVKAWLRQDIELWRDGDLKALPMGYLFCGPVGTGKTYMVECLAGSAGVPVVKIKNFRDKWVGSTEGNLETIFRLLHALGRCIVFIDEADQALGRRQADSGDSGVGGRIYSMFAEEMSNTRNRGKIVWVLASSRPDLIEVDLKRPGRIDVKIPLMPTATPQEGFALLRALCGRRGMDIGQTLPEDLTARIPQLLTPGAAETLAVKVYRTVRTQTTTPPEALRAALQDYQHPVPPDIMRFQIEIAVREASDLDFVPPLFREYVRDGEKGPPGNGKSPLSA